MSSQTKVRVSAATLVELQKARSAAITVQGEVQDYNATADASLSGDEPLSADHWEP